MDIPEGITEEQLRKARACKTPEELIALAQEEGYELTDDELEAVSGGEWNCWDICTKYVKPDTCRVRDCSGLRGFWYSLVRTSRVKGDCPLKDGFANDLLKNKKRFPCGNRVFPGRVDRI